MKRVSIVAAFFAFGLILHAQPPAPSTLPLVQAPDLVLQYSIKLPNVGSTDADGFAYGGSALAFNPARGSLFLVGYELAFKVAEINIPSAAGVATILQPLADVTEGRINSINPTSSNTKRVGGLLPWGTKLIISAYDSYDGAETQVLSHFVSGQTLSTTGDLQGPYQVGVAPLKAGIVSGYMGVVPQAWRAALGGPAFTGNAALAIIGRTSQGPAVSTFDPADVGVKVPAPASALVFYDQAHPLGAYNSLNPYYNGSTEIRGVVMPEGTRSVLFFGRHGSTFCYGAGTTNPALDMQPVPNEPTVHYCFDPQDSSKGTHGYPYRYHVWAYDANELAAVKAGTKFPFEVKPYATWALTFPTTSNITRIAGAAYDGATGRLFVSQGKADGDKPVIHVFKVTVGSAPPPPPPPPPAPASASAVSIVQPTQTTFPKTVKACWAPNAAADNVTSYAIMLDGGTPITVGPAVTADPDCPGEILALVTIPTPGLHTFSLVAVNAAGTRSAPSTLTQDFPAPPPPPPPPPPSGTSPDKTRIPPATSITDATGGVWTFSGSTILRNGQSTNGAGSILAWCGSVIYTLGTDAVNWYSYGPNGWTRQTAVDPCSTAPPPPPQPPPTCTDTTATNFGGPLPCTYPPPPPPPILTATVTSMVTAKDCTLQVVSTNPYGTGGSVTLYRNPGVKQGSTFTTPDANGVYARSATVPAGWYNTFAIWTKSGQPNVTAPTKTVLCGIP